MAKTKKIRYFVGDFETTVYEGQQRTDVWASALVEMLVNSEDVRIDGFLSDTYAYLSSLEENIIVYYHNLKFDGAFWVDWLLHNNFTVAINTDTIIEYLPNKSMPKNSFKCSISDMGQWYKIIIKTEKNTIELRDSLKLLPFSVAKIGKSFKTKHKKLDMEYTGFRYPGCLITDAEKAYIANDVLVVKEALEFMFSEGHDKLTIGSCCLSEFVHIFGKDEYDARFPDVYKISIDESIYGSNNAGEYIRKSYRGGWCYAVKARTNTVVHNGTTADVNSLYPSMMSSESGNRYPCGRPTFVTLKDSSSKVKEWWLKNLLEGDDSRYYFVRFKTRFYIKHNKLPFIQIKNTFRFAGNESLETSDFYDKKDKKYYTQYYKPTEEGTLVLTDTAVTLTTTITDLKLIYEHYNLVNFELLDFCYFNTEIGMFDEYMEKYKKIKQTSTGAMRELAKLFLNNLYGKMAASMDSSFKVPVLKDDGSVGLYDVHEEKKKPGYIPVGSAITSYARNFTIRAAQKNYYGVDKPGFIYADTDSIHCDLTPDKIKGINVHPTNFCCWKLESCWDEAIFVRQKTYIEHITHEDEQPIDAPYYNVKCAGMPDACKSLFVKSMTNYELTEEDKKKLTPQQQATIENRYSITDFKVGLVLPGKLMPRRIPGGILLTETTYEMR